MKENSKFTQESLQKAIENKDKTTLLEIFKTVPSIDLAEMASELSPEQLIYLFRTVGPSLSADFFTELSQDNKEKLVRAMTDKDLVELINSQPADEVTDAIEELPANLASRVMKAADPELRKDLNALLNYKEDTAGSIMTTEYLEFRDDCSVEEAIEEIRKRGRDAETVYTIFVRDSSRRFLGTVDLDDLIFAEPNTALSSIMNRDVVYCKTSDDQEEVGQLFRRYDLNALAVLNEDSRLVGVITIDDAVDVMAEEGSEDFARMTNMEPTEKPYMTLSTWDNAKRCIPWIIVLLVLGTFTSIIISFFQDKLASLAILAAFIPTLLDTGGNSGGQTTGLMVRGLALKEFGPKQAGKVLFKELKSGLLVGLCVAVFAFCWFMMEQYTGIVVNSDFAGTNIWNGNCWTLEFFDASAKIAALVALSAFIAITLAKIIGSLLPLAASALRLDPALLAQPLLTTIMDIVSLLVYFSVAMLFFPQLA